MLRCIAHTKSIVTQSYWVVGAVSLLIVSGCGGGPGTTTNTTGGGNTQVLLDDPLSFDGSVSGKLVDSQSTRASTEDTSAAQALPPTFETANTCVRFNDLAGNPLLDPNGNPIPEVDVQPDGSFVATGLPVGVDFTICGDIGKEGACDIESCITIPSDNGGVIGNLGNVQADPLTTTVLAKLRKEINDRGIDPSDLPISPAAVVTRVVDAYTHLFEESGIDVNITLSDIDNLTPSGLADFFDQAIPPSAQTGIDIAAGTIGLASAQGVEQAVLSIAEVFLRAGFPVADFPGGPDLSALASLDGIEVVTEEDIFGSNEGFPEFDEFDSVVDLQDLPPEFQDALATEFPEGITQDEIDTFLQDNPDLLTEISPDLIDQFTDESLLEPAQVEDIDGAPVFYRSVVIESDRNFGVDFESGNTSNAGPQLPVMNDYLLQEIATAHLAGHVISLDDLYQVMTSLNDGLGLRLTFELFDPNFFGPPLNIFQTADGRGKAISFEELFFRLFEEGVHDVDFENFDEKETQLRALLNELLGDTVPPSFDSLFGAFTTERIESIASLAERIRNAGAHLPFSRSGPSTFYVVADGDPFRTDDPSTVSAITVDANISVDGTVNVVTFNPDGNGAYFLAFTERTDDEGIVELIVRETGKFMHGNNGPIRLNMDDGAIFDPIAGIPFGQAVSESGIFFPGTVVTIINDEFVLDGSFDELSIAEFDEFAEAPQGPNEQLFVLATSPRFDSEPVRVDFDLNTGVATYNPAGHNLLMFLPDSEQTGVFALFNEDTGRPAGFDDPDSFFEAPPEQPENFDDFFNETEDFTEFDLFTEFADQTGDPIVDDGTDPLLTDDGTLPPPDDGSVEPIIEDTTVTTTDETVTPAEFVGDPTATDEFFDPGFILVAADSIVGLPIVKETFTHTFGTEVPNFNYDSSGDPFFDDINNNGVEDEGEPTAQFRPTLFDGGDWRSTDIRLYYRRADNNGPVSFEEVDFDSSTPATIDGVALVTRNFSPRINAFRFGRPNTAINLLTAFSPPSFFNGTQTLNGSTKVDILTAIAMINLMMDQVFNLEAVIDPDGTGPLPQESTLTDAHLFVPPIADPFILIIDGFRTHAVPTAVE